MASGDANGGLYIWALQDDVQVAQETPQPPNDDIVVITATMEDDEIQIIANNSDKENNDQQNEIQTQLARSNSNLSGSRNITRPNQNANRDENDPVLDDIPPNKETWTRQCVIRHMQDVNFVCFSPDGLRIASVSRDDSLAVHIVETGIVSFYCTSVMIISLQLIFWIVSVLKFKHNSNINTCAIYFK